jgi:glycosyltransferase involved in cell wall biosynthesis
MRFLHISTFYPPYSFGGDAMYVYRLCHQLGDRGHSVDVAHCVDSYHVLHPGEPEGKFAEHPNVRRCELRSSVGRLSPLISHQTGFPLLQQRKLRELLTGVPYDVIHIHNASLLGPGVFDLPASGNPIRFYTAHEHWLVCASHVLWKFDQRPCEKPECLKCVLKYRRPPQIWRYTNLLARKSEAIDQFFSPSEFTAQEHARRGFGKPVVCLPYFLDRVDTEWQHPGPRPNQRPYFFFVGRLEVIKGLQEVIAAWDDMPEYDLLVAGSGSYSEALRSQAKNNPRIRFLGHQSQAELGALYYHAVATVVPSVTYETFGIVCIEAFARKTPVVVHDLGGLAEVVDESHGGLRYRGREELVGAIRRLGESRYLRDELGENGYRAFLKHWTAEAHLEKYFGWIERVRWRQQERGSPAAVGV